MSDLFAHAGCKRLLAQERRAPAARVSRAAASATIEHGFTLVELLVAIAVLGFVMFPLGVAISTGVHTTVAASQRFTDAHGTQIAATYFAEDVASAATVTANDSSPCGGGGPSVVTFRWSDDVSPSSAASYVVRTVSGDRTLVRTLCRGGPPVETATIVTGLAAANPSVVCTPSCSAPSSVTLTVTQTSGNTFRLLGTRRSA